MKKILIIILLFAAYQIGTGQTIIPKQAVTLEIGGKGLIYSVNYEHRVQKNIVISAGLSFTHIKEKQTNKSSDIISFPVSASYIFNLVNQKHYMEVGIGTMNLLTTGNLTAYGGATDFFMNPNLILGYRYYPSAKNWSIRASFNPVYGTRSFADPKRTPFKPLGNRIQPWGGIGFSYRL